MKATRVRILAGLIAVGALAFAGAPAANAAPGGGGERVPAATCPERTRT